MYRDLMCGKISSTNEGKKVKLAGWVSRRRDHGQLIFIDLRDKSGIMQIVFNPETSQETHEKAKNLRSEWVISVTGTVNRRIEGAENKEISTGDYEMSVDSMDVLSKSKTPPFEISDNKEVSEEVRLKYRFLDLRRESMQNKLNLRHKVTRFIWDDLSSKGFTHIETPILIKSTPEGARDYVVPSRVNNGSFYALPQSPQQMKQMLMVSGCDRYFQIARCFRDEDLRADRQPEHTQLDLEMSFVHQNDVIDVVESLYIDLIKNIDKEIKVDSSFEKLTYSEAMDRFGTDKPDMRFGMELSNFTNIAQSIESNVISNSLKSGGILKGFVAKNLSKYGRRDFDRLTEKVKEQGAGGLIYISIPEDFDGEITLDKTSGPLNKFYSEKNFQDIRNLTTAEKGDVIFMIIGDEKIVNNSLSFLRNYIAKENGLIDDNIMKFLWVTDFPLFEKDDENKWQPAHHVFSSPKHEDIKFLDTDPGKVNADLFDLVCNGVELGSGSIRIHDRHLQEKVFDVIGYSSSEVSNLFGHLLDSFEFGVPPHGGMGLGLDRLVAMLAKEDSIREVIAFPKTQTASDLLFGSPDIITDEQLNELSIEIIEEEEKSKK
ncbi:MAG: aspartate--tRNA ligase [SAR202 cluster bacterium]|nr:aspartate--tRNA ligase [Chloroflexota bacterium]MQG43201.1 aspartate--tRNA ligase [SAR202 cluster bacterium]|tara:strand:- start:9169 stop:10971 length:1803 start_codon:yes stop_codon:yes gene_type:complete